MSRYIRGMKNPAAARAAIEKVRELREVHRQSGQLMQELEYTLSYELQLHEVGIDRKVTKITGIVTEEYIPRTGPKWAAHRNLALARKSWDTSPGKWIVGVKLEDGTEVVLKEAVLIYRRPRVEVEAAA